MSEIKHVGADTDLIISQSSVEFTPVKVNFKDYEYIKSSAERLNLELKAREVNEDNVQESKKLVAEVRKQFNALDQMRKDTEKEVMAEFNVFKDQVKEIGSIIGEGEDVVRSQIRELDDVQREAKKEKIKELWDDHAGRYKFVSWFGFEYWFEERFLNKTQSLNKLEESLVEWLEAHETDVSVIDSYPEREELMGYYLDHRGDLSRALVQLNHEKERKKQLEQVEKTVSRVKKVSQAYTVTVYDEADYRKLLHWLNDNSVDYTKDVIEL